MVIKESGFLHTIPIPEVAECRWDFPCPAIDDPEAEVKKILRQSSLRKKIKPGHRIAITAGSRGISRIDAILAAICHELKQLNAEPFLAPAMGSHGGGTREGQLGILKSFGITPEHIGAPIVWGNTVVEIGTTPEGMPVYMDEAALKADGILVINRIKAHTSFQAPVESGIAKMLAVGLGRDQGAQQIHRLGTRGLREGIQQAGQVILDKAPVLFGIGIIENALGSIAELHGLEREQIMEGEPLLLKRAKKLAPALPFTGIDVLVVSEMGKDISGTGLDTNVIGRRMITGEPDPALPSVSRIAVLDLSGKTQGNANGLGLADVITRRLYDKIDFAKTYANSITSTFIERAKIPMVMPTDRSAIQLGLKTCWVNNPREARLLWIRNTRSLQLFFISQSLAPEALLVDGLSCRQQFHQLSFNNAGDLMQRF
jgi:hypothetical protein